MTGSNGLFESQHGGTQTRTGLIVERRFRTIPEFSGRVLRVACLETADKVRIITVFFDRDAREPK